MKEKLRKLAKNKLARDIIAFYHDNQGCIDTASGIAAWVKEDKKKVKDILDQLVELGVLEQDETYSAKGYCYTRDKDTMKIVKDILKNDE